MKLKEKRELLFRVLFGQSFHQEQDLDAEALEVFNRNEKPVSEEDQAVVRQELEEIRKLLPEIDERINRRVERWNTATMAKVELAILRLTVYELFYKKEAPVGILAKDAVSLAAGYGQDAAYRFVNGAVSRLLEELPAESTGGNGEGEAE
ncbi:antitermination protein NusB [Lachnospiraceae bacterium oral taxon 500]|nr:antitermination protein NusB [Lachnospiraceae bacterium oral taxon 500]